MRFNREELDREKRRIRRDRDLKMIGDYLRELNLAAQAEVDVEDQGIGTSDEISRGETVRRMLEQGCQEVRAGCSKPDCRCKAEPGTYPSKRRVALHLDYSEAWIKKLWRSVSAPDEEWSPC